MLSPTAFAIDTAAENRPTRSTCCRSDAHGRIAWPPDMSIMMNVAGYREALAAAHAVEVDAGFIVRVASLPHLAILKLLAWADRGLEDPRDATDLVTLMRRYLEAGNEERLYGSESGLHERVGYDMDRAAPRLLGVDASRAITPATRAQVIHILDDARMSNRLVQDMARALRGVDDAVSAAETLVAQFKAGLTEPR